MVPATMIVLQLHQKTQTESVIVATATVIFAGIIVNFNFM